MEQPALAIEYELPGGGGKSKTTIDGRMTAIGAFNNFLETTLLPEYIVLREEIYQKVRPVGD